MTINAGGGGIYIFTSLVEAFQQLRDIPARVKHCILFSDAADAEEKAAGEMSDGAKGSGNSFDIASAMLAAKITTSVVGLGTEQDKDVPFLRQLAERGNGRFYLTDDATTLPQIFSTETMKVAQSSLIEEPFLAVAAGKSPITAGLDWPQSPLLLGYNATKLKPTADLLLTTERGEPLLATWRYGLGQAAAFTSDAKARWAAEWMTWPGFGKFWTQFVRGLMRKSDQASFQVNTRESGDRLELAIDAIKPDGSFRDRMPVTVSMLAPGRRDDNRGRHSRRSRQLPRRVRPASRRHFNFLRKFPRPARRRIRFRPHAELPSRIPQHRNERTFPAHLIRAQRRSLRPESRRHLPAAKRRLHAAQRPDRRLPHARAPAPPVGHLAKKAQLAVVTRIFHRSMRKTLTQGER